MGSNHGPLVPSITSFVLCVSLERYMASKLGKGIGCRGSYLSDYYDGEYRLTNNLIMIMDEINAEDSQMMRLPIIDKALLPSSHGSDTPDKMELDTHGIQWQWAPNYFHPLIKPLSTVKLHHSDGSNIQQNTINPSCLLSFYFLWYVVWQNIQGYPCLTHHQLFDKFGKKIRYNVPCTPLHQYVLSLLLMFLTVASSTPLATSLVLLSPSRTWGGYSTYVHRL
jgi:hypothetical protein